MRVERASLDLETRMKKQDYKKWLAKED